MAWGAIDDAAVAEARELIGVALRRDRMRWVERASRDAVRQFTLGVGDDNPRWRTLAPPSFLYAVDSTIVAPKLPGVQWVYAGTSWRWFDLVRVGEALDAEARLTGVDEKSGRTFPRWVLQRGTVRYTRAGGDLVAIAEGRTARTPRAGGGRRSGGNGGGPPPAQPAKPAPADRAAFREWEAVAEGDRVGPLAKGPLDLREVFAWYAGAQGAQHYGGAHGDGVRYRRRHDDYAVNRSTGAKEFAAAGHFDARSGRDVGLGGAYDVGPQRISWAVQLLTDWAGEGGFVHELDVDLRRPNLFGHVTTWSGRVEDKRMTSAGGCVEIALEARNQEGELTASGRANVLLPAGGGPVRLPLAPDEVSAT